MKTLLPLRSDHLELGEAIQRRAQAKESFQNAGEEKGARTGELVFVDLHLDLDAAGEAYALFSKPAMREMRL